MAKGWSFGALTAALKSSAFVDTTAAAGDTIGNAMTVGFSNIGRTSLSVASSLNMANYRWHQGEVIYVSYNNIAGLDAATKAKLVFSGTEAIRISCIAVADSVYTLMFQDAGTFYIITVNANQSAFTFDVKQLLTTDGADGANIYASSVNFGGKGQYQTLFFRDRRGSNQAYVQYDSPANNLYLSSGGTGRFTLRADGSVLSDNAMISSAGISDFWALQSSQTLLGSPPGSRIAMAKQGLHIGWNESGSSGMGSFVCNRGLGSGGFNFRTVNADNTVQLASWRMDASTGNFNASGDLASGPNRRVYSNNGASWLDADANVYGSVWGGYLSNWLNSSFNSRDQQINARATYDWVNSTFAPKNQLYGSVNGWFKDTSTGMIFQWGARQSSGQGIEAAGFNISFPNACLAVVATLGTSVGTGNTVYTANANNQGFNYKTSGNALGFTFLAVGY